MGKIKIKMLKKLPKNTRLNEIYLVENDFAINSLFTVAGREKFSAIKNCFRIYQHSSFTLNSTYQQLVRWMGGSGTL
jgi:hypothetical protein